MSLTLAAGGWSARLLPDQGAAFARLARDGRDVLAPVPDGADPNTAMAGAFWMAPWTNRLEARRVGRFGTVPINRPQDNTAIHGFVRDRPWRVLRADAASARLAVTLETAPLPCDLVLDVALTPAGLALDLALTSRGREALPFGMGWHPWFVRSPATHLRFAATTRFLHGDTPLPTGIASSTGLDVAGPALLGHDTHFAGWDGVARIDALTLRATGAWAGNLQVYAPPPLPVLCVEPVSHVPDVLNRPQYGAMHVLAPGESLSGGITLG